MVKMMSNTKYSKGGETHQASRRPPHGKAVRKKKNVYTITLKDLTEADILWLNVMGFDIEITKGKVGEK